MKARASPNIAFIKYWGKVPGSADSDRNLATNASLSMTLSAAQTTTSVRRRPDGEPTCVRINNQHANSTDLLKVSRHIDRVLEAFGRNPALTFDVDSHNNFPQGTGIASSASAFAALTLAVAGEVIGESEAKRILCDEPAVFSALARRGSGSASRSIEGGFVKWDGPAAHRLTTLDWPLHDTILIFSEEHKSVPSSAGHALAETSPEFAARLKRLPARLAQVESALAARDLARLGPVLEEEALELHAIAASSTPPIVYLTPGSLRFIETVGALTQRDFYFTLDAGPNVHLISQGPISGLEAIFRQCGLSSPPRIWADRCGAGARFLPDA